MRKIIIICMVLMICLSTSVYAQRYRIAYADTTTMFAPGVSDAVWCGDGQVNMIAWDFVVASIHTTVAVALQKKTGNGSWTNVFADSLVYTENGINSLLWYPIALADSIRFRWISESGGSNAVITHNAKLTGDN